MVFESLVGQFPYFCMVLVRLLGMFSFAPIFSSPLISVRVRATLAFVVSCVVFPVLSGTVGVGVPKDLGSYVYVFVNELVIGITFGLILALIFTAFQLAGQFFSVQMGFGINEVLDPLSEISVPLAGQFLALMASFIFFLVDGHVVMIEAVYESFSRLSAFYFVTSAEPLLDVIVSVFQEMFVIALRISLPIMGTLFIVNFVMGLLAKFAPQINILMLGFPIYVIVGFVILVAVLPFIVDNGKIMLAEYLEFLFDFR